MADPTDIKSLLELGKKARYAMYVDLLNRVSARESLSSADLKTMLTLEAEFSEILHASDAPSSPAPGDPVKTFPNLLKVLDYLQSQGYQVKKSKLYKDKKASLIAANAAGVFEAPEVGRYATANLQRINAVGTPDDPAQQRLGELQREKLETSTRIAQEQLRLLERRNMDLDSEIERRISTEIVNFLNLYKNILTNFFTGESEALIDLVKGDQRYAPEFIAATRQGINKAGVTVARHKGVALQVTPDGLLIRGSEVLSP